MTSYLHGCRPILSCAQQNQKRRIYLTAYIDWSDDFTSLYISVDGMLEVEACWAQDRMGWQMTKGQLSCKVFFVSE